tara:strand:+ start:120 stop:401 length:282 start_codon:yes stop_codon:yes gene_type:complete
MSVSKTCTIGLSVTPEELEFMKDFTKAYGFRSASEASRFLISAILQGVVRGEALGMVAWGMELQDRYNKHGRKELGLKGRQLPMPKHLFAQNT